MSQVYIRPEGLQGDRFTLDPKESHHVSHVLRKKNGDQIELFDGKGHRYVGEILSVDPETHRLSGRILKEISSKERITKVVLFQGLPKGSKFDFVIEKATELGVDRIVPFVSDKNPIQTTAESSLKRERWERLVEAASKQCGRSTVPLVEPPQALQELGEMLKEGISLVFSTGSDAKSLKSLFPELLKESPRQINLVVGPESGFSSYEMAWFGSIGGRSTSLGSLTFRTETAGLVALSIVNYELGLL